MGLTPVYGARAEKPLQNADFAMKQTNICRLSGDIKIGKLLIIYNPSHVRRKKLGVLWSTNEKVIDSNKCTP